MVTAQRKIVDFLNQIGIATTCVPGVRGFIDNVPIDSGRLLYDPNCFGGDLLHEAGHIAITPARWRPTLSGDIEDAIVRMCNEAVAEGWEPDDLRMRAVLQTGDSEATAWAWAAGRHLGLEPADIIAPNDPKSSHFGVHGLQHAGFCRARNYGFGSLPVFPKLAFWLQS